MAPSLYLASIIYTYDVKEGHDEIKLSQHVKHPFLYTRRKSVQLIAIFA